MKKFVTLFCVLMTPLVLASDTQHRFKVYVNVYGDDDQAINTIESHLKRELRLLGDVNVVGIDDNWEFMISISMMTLKFGDGRQTGSFAIGTYMAHRLDEYSYKHPISYKIMQATWGGVLGTAYYYREALPEFCIQHVNSFDKTKLKLARELLKGK